MNASGTPTGDDGSAYEALLHQVEVLYALHEARRKEPFNLFTVLRKASDEEHLHSKFLEVLLSRESNLEDFVQQVVAPAVDAERHVAERGEPQTTEPQVDDGGPLRHWESAPQVAPSSKVTNGVERMSTFSFSLDDARVKREQDYIDLLITNAKQQAIVIENKIWAGDQPQQLQRYFQTITQRGFKPTLVYLTLHGDAPSDDSRGDHEVFSLSYRQSLIPWLRRCQERACDEPALRESVAQYIALIRNLCGDSGREFMTEVKRVLRKGGNLVLASRLGNAVAEVWRDRLFDYWEAVRLDVDPALGAPVQSQKKLRDWLKVFVYGLKRKGFNQTHFHYAWRLSGWTAAWLAIEGNRHEGIFYGVICERDEHPEEYGRLREHLNSLGFGDAGSWWPGRKFVYRGEGGVKGPSEGAVKVLDDPQKRSEVVRDLDKTWESLRKP